MGQDDIARALEGLRRDVDDLTKKTINEMASAMADQRITAWEKRRVGFVVVILAIFGISSYFSITDKVSNYFLESVKPKITEVVREKSGFVSMQTSAMTDMQLQIADLSKTVDTLSKYIAKESNTKPIRIPSIPNVTVPVGGGWAFYGVRDASNEWTARYFNIVNPEDAGDRPPQAGDQLRAAGSVNIRTGHIVYTDAGWVNKPSVGILRTDTPVRVIEIKEVVSGFWWISFTPITHP